MINKAGLKIFKNINPTSKVEVSNHTSVSDKKEFSLKYNDKSLEVIGDIVEFSNNIKNLKNLYIFQDSGKFRTYLQQINNNFSKNFIFSSPEMRMIYSKVHKVAKTTTTVFITGESGTGKEIIANMIHSNSDRF